MLSYDRAGYGFVVCLGFVTTVSFAGGNIDPAQGQWDEKQNVRWYDVRLADVEGQGWTDLKAPFDRLPAKAEKTVRSAVWNLSRHSAGLLVRFTTDAPTIKARWTLTSPRLAMPHMPATGVSGFDLYVKTEKAGVGSASAGPPAKLTPPPWSPAFPRRNATICCTCRSTMA